MAGVETPTSRLASGAEMIELEEWRNYAADVLAQWITGPTERMSDDRQRRIKLLTVLPGTVAVLIEGSVDEDLGEPDRNITFRITADEDAALVTVEPAPPEKTPEQLEIDRLHEEIANLHRRLGETEVSHREQMRTARKNAEDEIKTARQEINAEFLATKRKEAEATAARSRVSLVAKIAEHFAPLMIGFPYNFKEVRHVGEIFDFLVYEGLEEGEIRNIVFLEVKTKKSGARVTNPRERMLRKAIQEGRVKYEVFVPDVGDAKVDRAST